MKRYAEPMERARQLKGEIRFVAQYFKKTYSVRAERGFTLLTIPSN
jgi:hypothetical protein